jgi:hypothetical protein
VWRKDAFQPFQESHDIYCSSENGCGLIRTRNSGSVPFSMPECSCHF